MSAGNEEKTRALPLEAFHAQAGAQPMPLGQWNLPAHYGDPEGEYRAARESVALMDVSSLAKVTARGKDHIEYLNRRLSQYTMDMQPGDGRRANQLNGEGRMEADFMFYRLTEELSLLLAPPTVSGTYIQALADKYVFTEEAVFEDATEAWAAFALFGPKAGDVLKALGIEGLRESSQAAAVNVEGVQGYLLAAEFLPGAVVLLVEQGSAEKVFQALHGETKNAGGSLLGFLPFDTLRVEAGQPWYGIDLTDRSIPLDADLMSAIHTNKGCYPGQETIAKILNLGHPARKLVGVVWESEDPPPAGTGLHTGTREAGTLTSSTYSPTLGKAVGLAVVRWPYREPGTELSAGDLHGRVVNLPFT